MSGEVTDGAWVESEVWGLLQTLRKGLAPGIPVLYSSSFRKLGRTEVSEHLAALANNADGGVWFIGVYGTMGWKASSEALPDDLPVILERGRRELVPPPSIAVAADGTVAAIRVESVLATGRICHLGDPVRGPVPVASNRRVQRADGLPLLRLQDRIGLADAELASSTLTAGDLDRALMNAAGIGASDAGALGIVGTYGVPTLTGATAFASAAAIDRAGAQAFWLSEVPHGAAEAEARGLAAGDHQPVAGCLAVAIDRVAAELADWLPVERPAPSAERLFGELLVNAVGHRSYVPPARTSDSSGTRFGVVTGMARRRAPDSAVLITIFADRVRISNPGGLPLGRVHSNGPDRVSGRFSRNPHLMALLQQLGLARQNGTGLAVARREAANAGCGLELLDAAERFTVDVVVDPELTAELDRPGAGIVSVQRTRIPRAERRDRVLAALARGPLSARELAGALLWPLPTVRAALGRMVKMKLIARTAQSPRAPNQRYRIRIS